MKFSQLELISAYIRALSVRLYIHVVACRCLSHEWDWCYCCVVLLRLVIKRLMYSRRYISLSNDKKLAIYSVNVKSAVIN